MASEEVLTGLTNFFKAAGHLWGRCPACGDLFRLSDAAISFGSEPPKDWLRRLLKEKKILNEKATELEGWEEELQSQEGDLQCRTREINTRERNLNREIKRLSYEYLKSDDRVKQVIREHNRAAILKSRATLLGKLFERLAPFLQKFRHDPRDIRPIMDPIDYVCFDGLTVERRVNRISFVEVKSGTSSLSTTQRSILQAVQEGRVSTEVWEFGARNIPLQQQLRLPRQT